MRRREGASSAKPVKVNDRSIILVATDVAARGLDIDDVGLCLQLGAPLKAGRRGVLDADLYAHRFGRAARGGEAGAASIVAFDATAGEAPLVEALSENYPDLWPSKPPPAPSKVRAAAIKRALGACDRVDDDTVAAVLGDLPALSDNEAKRLLAAALAALANVKAQGRRSRETGKASDRTLKVTASSGGLAPGAVVKALKALGSGKLGRVRVVDDGCGAYVEVPAKRAGRSRRRRGNGRAPEGWGLAEDLERFVVRVSSFVSVAPEPMACSRRTGGSLDGTSMDVWWWPFGERARRSVVQEQMRVQRDMQLSRADPEARQRLGRFRVLVQKENEILRWGASIHQRKNNFFKSARDIGPVRHEPGSLKRNFIL